MSNRSIFATRYYFSLFAGGGWNLRETVQPDGFHGPLQPHGRGLFCSL